MIYFIEAIGADRVKIGYTDGDPESRMKSLQTGCPHRLRLLAAVDGDMDAERALHQAFDHLCTVGEWFTFGPDLRGFIEAIRWLVPAIYSVKSWAANMMLRLNKSLTEHAERLGRIEADLFPDHLTNDEDEPIGMIEALNETDDQHELQIETLEIDSGDYRRQLNDHRECLELLVRTVFKKHAADNCVSLRTVGADCRA